MKISRLSGFLFVLSGLFLAFQACKSTAPSHRRASGRAFETVDRDETRRQDSLLIMKYVAILDAPAPVIGKSLPVYKFIDLWLKTPYGKASGESAMDDVRLVVELYNEVYRRKIPGTYEDLMISKLIPKFSDRTYLAEGDFLFFEVEKPNQPGSYIVGVYLLNDRFITSSKYTGAVAIGDLSNDYWNSHFKLAGRLR